MVESYLPQSELLSKLSKPPVPKEAPADSQLAYDVKGTRMTRPIVPAIAGGAGA